MKHFIFDLGGVLQKAISTDDLSEEDFYINCNSEHIKKLFSESFIKYEKGEINTKDFVSIMNPYFNKKNLTVEEYEKNYIEVGIKDELKYDHVEKLLTDLKKEGYKIYLLSNLHELTFKDFSNNFNVDIFDELFLSYKIHLLKPDEAIYKYVVKNIGDEPKNMCFFDDKIKNVEAAVLSGMNSMVTTGLTLEKNINIMKRKWQNNESK